MRTNIELVESLCGFRKVVRTLDDRDLVLSTLPGEVTKHADIKFVPNEGIKYYFSRLKSHLKYVLILICIL